MRTRFSIIWIAAVAQAATYFQWSNHDGVQVGSKYVYFASPTGVHPTPETYNEATATCEATGGELAYPVDATEDAAFMQFLTQHFNGDQEAVAEAAGAWLGISMNSTGAFVYNDGKEASYVPIDFFSRLVADFNICLSMTFGRMFNENTASFEETIIWDEGFCRRHRMPLCMVDLANEVSCNMIGDDITSDVITMDCDGYSRCIDGNYTEFACEGGMRFSVNGSEFGGDCIDAREVPECDIDECANGAWNSTVNCVVDCSASEEVQDEEDRNCDIVCSGQPTCPNFHSVNCTNLIGTHECGCDTGLRFNDSDSYWNYETWSCDDIDECVEGLDDCNDDSNCINTFGSFMCECHTGFYYEDLSWAGECVDYDECMDGVYYHKNTWPPQLIGTAAYYGVLPNDTWVYVDACHDDAFCSNMIGTFNCTCNDGFRMNSTDMWTCHDIDECAEGIDECHADSWCNNTYGGYECYCNDGYYGDGFECVDSDECADMTEAGVVNNVTDHLYMSNECSDQGFCTNTIGGYNCTCNDGFYGSGYNCTDGNECGDVTIGTTDGIEDFYFDSHECNPEGTCINTFGGYNCTCNEGFYGDGFNCSDSNECGDMAIGWAAGVEDPIFDSHMCSSEGTCTNTWGNYNCTCNEGFYGDGFNCTDGNECGDAPIGMAAGVEDHSYEDHTCDIQASCINTFGAYNCSCNLGYEGDGWNCTDIDECREEMRMEFETMSMAPDALIGGYDFCSPDASCQNTPGGYNCTCNEGYEGNGFNCTDIDECAHGIDECDLEGDRAWCNNTIGSYECYCNDGYYGDGFSCTNSDECGAVCDSEACGSACDFVGDAGDMCMYACWPECSDPTDVGIHMNVSDGWWGSHQCSELGVCNDTVGSYDCNCNWGYEGDGFNCTDVDECDVGTDMCHDDADCTNEFGGYNCTCSVGYTGDGFNCTDIDECEMEDACHEDATCTNTVGAYECDCNDGFFGNGFNQCLDSDECAEIDVETYMSLGEVNAWGYDIMDMNYTDPLHTVNGCSAQGMCMNTYGGYNCTCNDGFFGSGWNCTDGNECGDEMMVTTDGVNDYYWDTHMCNPEGTCINTFGGYNCTCNEGFYGDGYNCSDSNECGYAIIGWAGGVEDPIFDSHMCSSEGTCSNTWGGYNCTCDDGFYGDGFNCTDGNECGDAPIGMAAGVEDHYFEDHMCHVEASCINTFGAYNCSCDLGWEGDGWNCTEIDECRAKIDEMRAAAPPHLIGEYDYCHDDAFCTNTPGGYNCTCNEGFSGDGFNCTDIDECALGIDECDLEGGRAWCNNTYGGYECYCNDGYYGDGFSCTNSDECGVDCGGESCEYECHDAMDQGSECNYFCWPPCGDTNEVGMHMNVSDSWYGTNDCSMMGYCNDTIGSYSCSCRWGFAGDGFNCTDIDECDSDTHMCHDDAVCENEFGGYNCTCDVGYIGDGFNCTDIDECERDDACHEDATCTNTVGAYECDCNDGFFGNGFNQCLDSDECGEDDVKTYSSMGEVNVWGYAIADMNHTDSLHFVNGCSAQGMCMNTYGGYNCTCNDGFFGSGWNCTDGNECGDEMMVTTDGVNDYYWDTHMCNGEGTCVNSFGGYNCTCNEGFYGDGFNCSDSNECGDMPIGMTAGVEDPIFDSHMCSSEGTCSNTWGGYNCTCDDGFYGDGFNCTDGNECGDAPVGMAAGVEDHYFEDHMCHVEASCINTFGAYNCSCNLGYEGDGWNCTEIDECRAKIEEMRAAAPPHLIGEYDYCHDDAFCTNTPGGYNCTCNEGFSGDGFNCTDIDECALGIDECDLEGSRAWCNNTYGGYECYCNDGYYGDGFSCVNSDECAVDCIGEMCDYDCSDAIDQGSECMFACWASCGDANEVGMHMNVSDSWYGTNQCSDLGVCNDTIGSYSCSCPWGFDGDGFNCTDIDECDSDTHMCHDDAVCENEFGGYNCTCDVGYIGDGFNCTDIDECERDDACHEDATCTNTVGAYECDCNDGFFGNGFNQCLDSDECAEMDVETYMSLGEVNAWGYDIMDMNYTDPLHTVNGCSAQGMCMNTYGGYNCTCNDGFFGSGWNCTDGNECGDEMMVTTDGVNDYYWDTHMCNPEGTCINTFGGYNCTCNEGFYGDGYNCSDSNECGDEPIGMDSGVEDPIFDSHMCSSEGTCSNTWGGYNCTCDDGFYGDGFNCTDGNECGDAPIGMAAGVEDHYYEDHMCHAEASCINTFGAYNCSCNLGYTGDGWNCTEIDECRAKIEELRSMAPPHLIGEYDYCHDDAFCTNTPGGYNCTCNEGFSGDGFNCTDIDECTDEIDECHVDATCTNTYGAYNCTCNAGFSGDGFNCTDVDECAEGMDQCHDNAWCNNTYGDYECYCNEGYYGNGFDCEDSDECAADAQGMVANVTDEDWGTHECHDEAFCTNLDGSYNCTCDEGWAGDGFNCTDVDECDEGTDDCSEDGFCMNTIGAYDCACSDGYFGDGWICVDSDECAEGEEAMTVTNVTDPLFSLHECSDDAFCSNVVGAYNCTCNEGYSGNGWNCTDINECDEDTDECHDEGACSNTIGSYDCACDDGFFGDGWFCEDSDECAEDVEAMVVMNVTDPLYEVNDCHADSFCMNSYGAYNCTCNEGFEGDGFNCTDVDECDEGSDDCSDNAECTNTYGSWECACDNGWFGDGVECEDSDECAEGAEAVVFLNVTDPWYADNDCSDDGFCSNTPGFYNCTCNDGYSGDGFNCTDVNECDEGTDMCHADADCINTIGGYNCSCIVGYEGHGFDCVDVDECAMDDARTIGGAHDCNDNAECVNFAGGYNCTCNVGYYGDGYNCTDSDECNDFGSAGVSSGFVDPLWDSDECSESGTCVNTDGGYNCTCNEGFFGDGFECTDSNECGDLPVVTTADVEDPIFESHMCHAEAACVNTVGAYNCSCDLGWEGDGWNCTDIDECVNLRMVSTAASDDLIGGFDFCDDNAMCMNTPGGYNCSCNHGYEGDGFNCTDVDECMEGTDECHADADCSNTIGSYECTCNDGFYGDGRCCIDGDECGTGDVLADSFDDWQGCMEMYNDSMSIFSPPADILFASEDCSVDAACMNTAGSYNCTCNDGYEGDGFNCTDIDECEEGTDWCGANNADCINNIGGYNCSCQEGFTGDGFDPIWLISRIDFTGCEDIDECAEETDDCDVNAICTNTIGAWNCTCMDGYQGNGTENNCFDVDECAESDLNDCDDNAFCDNTVGSYECSCNTGYYGDGFMCEDSDECGYSNCTVECMMPDANCTDAGVAGESCTANCVTTCEDNEIGVVNNVTDDAFENSYCDKDQATCTNVAGGYKCGCNWGWKQVALYTDGGVDCNDVDECDSGNYTAECHDEATCTNAVGNYICTCNDGYTGTGFDCADVDECDLELDECHDNADCTNTVGSYNCTCLDGYSGDGFNCTNVDECALDLDECHDMADCTDTDGSYNCTCVTGYEGDGFDCVDIDECVDEPCDSNAACNNTIGSYTCACNEGYYGDGHSCTDSNECGDEPIATDANGIEDGHWDTHTCSDVADCANTDGAYNCTCHDGYEGDGFTCENIDECAEETDTCHADAYCTDDVPGFNCTCNEGYDGDGFDCIDGDECALETDDCDENALCENLPGGFSCTCNAGYTDASCPEGWEGAFGLCHLYNSAVVTYSVALADCQSQGGWVAYVTSKEHNTFLSTHAGGDTSWLGYTETLEDGKWRWRDARGERFPDGYTNWHNGQPDNPEDEACMHLTAAGRWKNNECEGVSRSYICQMESSAPGRNCTDINECTEPGGDELCDTNGVCNNFGGGYFCECADGFQGDGTPGTCVDVDECLIPGLANCHAEATCNNTIGSFECNCNDGFTGDGVNKCRDVHECFEGTDNCHDNAECENTIGSFDCTCNEGYSGPGDECFDVEECTLETDDCNANAACVNTDGSFSCECNEGYSGDGHEGGSSCVDNDECSDGTAVCQEFADCSNTDGGYDCVCQDGFWPMSGTCFDINECTIPVLNDCDTASGAICNNVPGSYGCECPEGFGGTGTTADPCTDTLGECDAFSMDGYIIDPLCVDLGENTVCNVDCDEANDYHDNMDGDEAHFHMKCTCTGDRNDVDNLDCNWEPVDPTSQCNLCPAVSDITWFGDHTNDIKVQGPDGQLVDSRVMNNVAISGDWSAYTVYLLLPGDWTNARIFTWVFDVVSMELEDDESSTLVVLQQNANSPTLSAAWSQFFVGFDNIQSFIDAGTNLDYKIGVVPSVTTDSQCVMGHFPVAPEESTSRSAPRKMARQHARRLARQNAGGN